MEWLLDKRKDHTTKSLRSEDVGDFKSQWLKENVYLAPPLRRETKGHLIVGKGPYPKS